MHSARTKSGYKGFGATSDFGRCASQVPRQRFSSTYTLLFFVIFAALPRLPRYADLAATLNDTQAESKTLEDLQSAKTRAESIEQFLVDDAAFQRKKATEITRLASSAEAPSAAGPFRRSSQETREYVLQTRSGGRRSSDDMSERSEAMVRDGVIVNGRASGIKTLSGADLLDAGKPPKELRKSSWHPDVHPDVLAGGV